MSFNVEEFINRYKERAEAVKNRSIPPVGGDDRMAFIKQAETDFQDYMIIADSEFMTKDSEFTKDKVIDIHKESNHTKINFKNKKSFLCRAVIFTEVLNSELQKIYNVKYNFFEYGQTAISATLKHSKSHKGYAFQFFQKNGPLALLPMINKRGNNYSSLVWTEKTDNISSLLLSKKSLEESLNNLCSDYL